MGDLNHIFYIRRGYNNRKYIFALANLDKNKVINLAKCNYSIVDWDSLEFAKRANMSCKNEALQAKMDQY